jgi:hypothetical protein
MKYYHNMVKRLYYRLYNRSYTEAMNIYLAERKFLNNDVMYNDDMYYIIYYVSKC